MQQVMWPVVLGCLVSLPEFGRTVDAASAPRPNIVFILADDWGWGDLGCYGNQQIKTPNLDRLAKQGTLFTQFYVNGSVCSPTRAAFLTGRFPARLAMHGHLATPEQNQSRGMPNFLDPKLPTAARFLQKAGYATGHFGKWHLGSRGGAEAPEPDQYGFAQWKIAESKTWNLHQPSLRSRSSEMIVDETIRFIEKHQEKPFYVQAWLCDTHATLNPTDQQMKPYENIAPGGVPFRSATQVYYAAATDADRHIGRLLRKLDELKLAENTLVVFSSDNGPEDILVRNAGHSGVGSAGPFRGRKRSLYEGGVRLPFIARWPRITPPGRVDDTSVISGVDWLPTLCRLAGVQLPQDADVDGEDLADVLHGKTKVRKKPLFWEWRFGIAGHVLHRSPMLAIRESKWKLLLNPDRSRVELYDIPADPSELNNRAEKHPEVVENLAKKALAWQTTLPKGPVDRGAGSNAYPWPKQK